MKNRGISLIVLVITIIVMSILLGVVVVNIQKQDVITNANETKIKSDISAIKEEYNNYVSHMEYEYTLKGEVYSKSKLNAGKENVMYDGDKIEGINTIKDILPSIVNSNYNNSFEIKEGKLEFVTDGDYNFTDEQKTWIEEALK